MPHDREALGPADVPDETLTGFVAAALGEPVRLLDSRVEPVDYPLETMTTGARWWVRGTAVCTDGRSASYRFFVKVVRTLARSPIFELIPEEHRAGALATLPWRIEADAYRGGLRDALPEGMRMPRCHAVLDLDEESAALWLEAVEHEAAPWGEDEYREAAVLLGSLAASASVAAVTDGHSHPGGPAAVRMQWEGRIRALHLATYARPGFWEHPLLRTHVDDGLCERLQRLVAQVPRMLDEIETLPLLNAHGDACPQNLLRTPGGLVALDWGFWCRGRLGFDLGQLVHGELSLGRMRAVEVGGVRAAALDGYREGLARQGTVVTAAELARADALQSAVLHGVTAVPVEELMGPPPEHGSPSYDALDAVVRERTAALPDLLSAVGV